MSRSPFKFGGNKILPINGFDSPVSVAEVIEYNPDSPLELQYHQTIRFWAGNSIGTLWTIEMDNLKSCGTTYEAIMCLRRTADLLKEIDYDDRITFCKLDFDKSVNYLLESPFGSVREINAEITKMILIFFNQTKYGRLPADIMLEVFLWLPIDEIYSAICVNREWMQIGTGDTLWKVFYFQKFIHNNPNSLPTGPLRDYRTLFATRLIDPFIGDKVEVVWKGKFRLESTDVYQGTAWWVAEIVDKHSAQERYKIHYPGWESRWDEWVPRSRFRWAVESNLIVSINPSDRVELWCCGSNVPGAWLEGKVSKARNGQYCINKVSVTGNPVWVGREKLRLAKKRVSDQMRRCASIDSDLDQAANEGGDGAADESVNGGARGIFRVRGHIVQRMQACTIM